MLTVAQRKSAQFGTAHNGAGCQGCWRWLPIGSIFPLLTAIRLSLLLCLCHYHLRRMIWNNPANDSCKEIVANLSAIAKINLFQSFGLLHHLKYCRASDIPNTLHPPDPHARSAYFCQLSKALVCYVEAITHVDVLWSSANKRADHIDQCSVCDFAVVLCEIEVVQNVR